MITKEQIGEWIRSINTYRTNLQTGGGALFSATYSKENNALYESATACQNLLTMYYNYDSLNETQLKRLKTIMSDMNLKAHAYEEAKRKNRKERYALVDSPRDGIIAATGDKKTRLQAAADMALLTRDAIRFTLDTEIAAQAGKEPTKLPSEYAKLDEKLGDGDVSASDIIKNTKKLTKDHKARMEIIHFHQSAVEAVEDYNEAVKNSFWGKKTTIGVMTKEFKELENLHRLELLKYNNGSDFMNSYKANRYKIRQVVDIYNNAMEWKKGTPKEQRIYNLLRVSLGLTNKQFEELGEKISTLEMIGRHMDHRMSMYANPEFAKMGLDELKKLAPLKKDELEKKLKDAENNFNNPQLPVEYKPSTDKIRFFKDAIAYRSLEDLGIKQNISTSARAEKSYINRTVGDKLKRNFKFLNAQARVGRQKMKADGIAGAVDMPVMLKAKLGKVSLKYASKNGLVSAGAHAGALGAKAVGSVGLGFSLKNPASIQLSAVGSAEAYALRGVVKGSVGKPNINLSGNLQGHVGHAKAEGTLAFGHIYQEKDNGELIVDGFGVSAKGGATAAVLNGKAVAGFSVFGVRIGFEANGKALGIGAEGEFTFMPANGIKLGGGGALGFGGSFYVSVDWRGLVTKVKHWKERRAISKKTLAAKKAEEKARKQAKANKKRRNSISGNQVEAAKDDQAKIKRSNSIAKTNTIKKSIKDNNAANNNKKHVNNNVNNNNHNINASNSLGK